MIDLQIQKYNLNIGSSILLIDPSLYKNDSKSKEKSVVIFNLEQLVPLHEFDIEGFKNEESLENTAKSLYKERNFAKAADAFTVLIRDFDSPYYYSNRSMCYFEMRDY